MTLTLHGLNLEYVEPKFIERLHYDSDEETVHSSVDLETFSSSSEKKQIKEILRNSHWSVDHPIRQQLWEVLCNRLSPESHATLYSEVLQDLFGEHYHPTSLPSYIDPAYCTRYHLNVQGRKGVERVLHAIRHVKPDITYSAVMYPLISLFLHYMSEATAFSCVYKLLSDKQNFISQTKTAHIASAYLVMKLTKKYAKGAYTQLERELKEHEDLESMFHNWLAWIFKGLPFSYMVRVVDCFLLERKKSLYRIVLALLILYGKYADKIVNEDLGMMQKLLDFCQNIPVSVERLFKIAYGIRGFSEKIVNQQLVKAEMKVKSQSSTVERSVSADRLLVAESAYHVEMNASAQPVVRQLKMDTSNRTRSLGVVALGNFKSEIITPEQMSTIWSWLPLRISMMQPEVIYSTNKHGVSLTAFYMTAGSWEPTALVIKSMNDEIFGAYCSSSWNSRNSTDAENKKYSYFGTGESFLFTLVPETKKFAWIGCETSEDVPHSAKLFMAADNTMISVGAGNGQGLLLDEQLLHGRTDRCDTFNNQPLCSCKDFQCKIVEVIAFK